MLKSAKSFIALFLFVIISFAVISAAYAQPDHHRTSEERWRSRYSRVMPK